MATQDTILANMTALGFDNPSKVAIYNKIAQACGLSIDVTLTELKNSETRILDIIKNERFGKDGYYTELARKFQYGDNLIEDPITHDYFYAIEDTAKRIVTQAAFEEITFGNSSQLFLKIATLNNTTGLLEPLSLAQYNAFKNYFVNFELPGLPVSIINNPANILFFTGNATYYATYDLPTLQTNLADALYFFRTSFDFNGEFFDGDLEKFIKSNVPGIRDFYLFNATVDNMPYQGSINLTSGYFNYGVNILNNISYIPR